MNSSAEHTLNRARAIHELQLQTGFAVLEDGKPLGYAFPAEFVDDSNWPALQAANPQLVLSVTRARFIGLTSQTIDASGLSMSELWAWIAGSKNTLPAMPAPMTAPDFAEELITIAKQAAIIPALLWCAAPPPAGLFSLEKGALKHIPEIQLICGEPVCLPVEDAPLATLISFRTRHDASVHLALVLHPLKADSIPLVRVHSSCVTGDLLGSLRCDCGGQLQQALKQMKEDGSGILLYLHQEGRDIGITSKLRAYALQEAGMDTYAANQQLGFEEDERDFSLAAAMLKSLGCTNIRLLTNNPDKMTALDASGIHIQERIALHSIATPHNQPYLHTKKIQGGHLF